MAPLPPEARGVTKSRDVTAISVRHPIQIESHGIPMSLIGRTGHCVSSPKTSAVFHDHVLYAHVMEHLVHGARRLRAAGLADYLGRDAGNRNIVGYRFDDHGARRNAGAVADLNVAEDFRAGPD